MKRVELNELLGLGAYESVRERFRERVIALKNRRRVALGSNMTVLFENHDTVLWQVQEMLRTERITAEKAVLHELDTYNQLIPNQDEFSATIFIEYPDADERGRMLVALAGVEDKFYLTVDGTRLPVRNETGAPRTDRTTAVQYVKFALDGSSSAALRGGKAAILLGVDHPMYQAQTVLSADTISELVQDLS